LPLYALAHRERLAGITFAVLAPGKAEFRGLARTAEIAVGIRDYASCKPNAKPANAETWDDLLAHWDAVLQGLGKQFLAGEAAVDPLRDECNYCHLAGLCRVTELNGVRDSAVEEGGDD
jgi:ATP-dependent helicase/DNAse subunit B